MIFDQIDSGRHIKILCLDGVTDVHNAAAIMRTAAFYDVDCIVIATKNNFGVGPSVARIASGALEYVKIVKCSSLPKFISALKKRGVEPIGLTEHTDDSEFVVPGGSRCLILGAEDKGLSNATVRLLDKKIKLNPQGSIQSLNVSVAAAIAMERVFV
ncbi:RNA methyltransferase [Bacteriovorax sp. DB6_IX]|uniref:23S rRNA (guanosine(2251)-2'-O)-methyltransferase RlmB n=1 Tax=Bacteriovorax sp. DB6_IX TaxID=1353530 RepID=UPI00038A29B6|nr:RNA methyltransferase [Bacteriovorax sp. DB6_IX]EQC51205.1 RNA methyltransferase, TrmH family [Bacteriovorax sp. DB6_IX]